MQVDPTFVAALVGAVSALVVVLIKEVIIEGVRMRRQERRDLLNRRLSEVYSPLWVSFGGDQGALPNVLQSEEMRSRLAANFHLLSDDLQTLLDEALLLVRRRGEGWEMGLHDGHRLIELTPQFKRLLIRDIEGLRSELFGKKKW